MSTSLVLIRRDGTIDHSVVIAPGVRLTTSRYPHGSERALEWALFYSGKPDALVAAGICTDDMIATTGKGCSFEGTDALGRPFDGRWTFGYRPGAPRAVRSVYIAWRDLSFAAAMNFPGAPSAMEAWNEYCHVLEERHRREGRTLGRRAYLRLVVDNTRKDAGGD